MTAGPRDAPDASPPGIATEPNRSTARGDAGRAKRMVSTVLGGALLALGVRRRSLRGAATALAGGWLLYRGLVGRGNSRRTLGPGATGRDRRETGASAGATAVERSITIGKPADELHRLWRDPEQLSRVVGHFAEVERSNGDPDRLRWTVRGPLGRRPSWETRVVEDRPGESLRWESLDGARVPNEGSIRFRPAPGDRGTEATLRVRFDPPGGALGDAAMNLLGVVPDALAGTALRRFKSLAETGEIPTLERNPSGRGSGDLL